MISMDQRYADADAAEALRRGEEPGPVGSFHLPPGSYDGEAAAAAWDRYRRTCTAKEECNCDA